MHLGKKLRRMRQARGLTAVELAQRARVTTGFISQLEHSQTVPSLQTLQRIAAVLGSTTMRHMVEVETESHGLRMHGFVSLPSLRPTTSRRTSGTPT